MSPLHATLLGILQGLGEFLPISSSAHLILIPWLLGWEEHSLAFDVALHLGTLMALLYAFAGDWWRLLGGSLRDALRGAPFASAEGRLLGLLVLASIPGGLAGLLLEKWADTTFRSPALVASALAVLGAVLFVADRQETLTADLSRLTVKDALLIGAAQALAIVPGVSRSGATISMALFRGYRREEAARFSFLLATPIIFGAAAVKVPRLLRGGGSEWVLLGMGAAAVFGLLSIRLLLKYVRTGNYRPFAYYRWALAALVLGVVLVRHLKLG